MGDDDSSFSPRRAWTLRLSLDAASVLALALVAVAYLVHFGAVCRFAVDVPYWDEWTFLLADDAPLAGPFSFEWLFRRHNEHRIVFSKLQVLLLHRLTGWDLVAQIATNFVLFGAGLVGLGALMRRIDPRLPLGVAAALLVFLLSPLNFENHSWGLCSASHAGLFLPLVAAWALFSSSQTPARLALGVVAGLLAAYSQIAGLAACFVLLVLYLAFKASRAVEPGRDRRHELRQAGAVALVLSLGLALWFVGYEHVPGHPPPSLPWTGRFWVFFLNSISFGLGYTAESTAWGLLCLVLTIAPVVALFVRGRGRPPVEVWLLSAIVLSLLGVLAAMSIGRAGFDHERVGKVSRYFQFSAALIPFTYMGWRTLLAGRPQGRRAAGVAIWLIAALGMHDDLTLESYRLAHAQRQHGRALIQSHYTDGSPRRIPILSPAPDLTDALERARKAGVSFARDLAPAPVPIQRPGNDPPLGALDVVGPDGVVQGWALDPDDAGKQVSVSLYLDGLPGEGGKRVASGLANAVRDDVTLVTGYRGDHGFQIPLPPALHDGAPHTLRAFADDLGGAGPQQIGGEIEFRLDR